MTIAMNRRSFMGSIAGAGVAAALLPGMAVAKAAE